MAPTKGMQVHYFGPLGYGSQEPHKGTVSAVSFERSKPQVILDLVSADGHQLPFTRSGVPFLESPPEIRPVDHYCIPVPAATEPALAPLAE